MRRQKPQEGAADLFPRAPLKPWQTGQDPTPRAHFQGATYEPGKDQVRLSGQLARVYEAMKGGAWFTLAQLAKAAEGSEASVSARIRDLRKPANGGHTIERERVEGGLYRYRLAPGN